MQIDYEAMMYARRTYPIFLRRYVIAAAMGRHSSIPQPIRESVDAIFKGNDAVGPPTIRWIYSALYNWRVNTGTERALPEDFTPPPETARPVAVEDEGPTTGEKILAVTNAVSNAVLAHSLRSLGRQIMRF